MSVLAFERPGSIGALALHATAVKGLACACLFVLLLASAHCADALASTSTTIVPTLSPDRLGAKATLTIAVHYANSAGGVPEPVRQSAIRLPQGLSLAIPRLRGCSIARLRARGPGGCPSQSRIGGGHALIEVHAGSQTIVEKLSMSAFLGFPRGNNPSFEILGEGFTPIEQREVLSGEALPDSPPYGERLLMSIPPIPTMPLEPDASIVSFTLTIGERRTRPRQEVNSVIVPSRCPASGFPFAVESTYAGGATSSAAATARCPR